MTRLSGPEPLEAILATPGTRAAGPLIDYDRPGDAASADSAKAGTSTGDMGAAEAHADSTDVAVPCGPAVPVPGIEPTHARRIAAVATGCTQARNQVLRDALAAGRVGVPAAKTALDEVDTVMHVLPDATRDEVFGHFLDLPAGAGARAIRQLTQRLVTTYAGPEQLDRDHDRHEAAERLRWTPLPNGLTRLEADLSPTHAAELDHAIAALSRPAPGNTCCDTPTHRHVGSATGEVDPRTPGQRRLDALILLVGRGAVGIDSDPEVATSGPARLVVTLDYDTLTGQLAQGGHTPDEHVITGPGLRRLACDADLIPLVLATPSQPLDVGRRHRLITGELGAAVVARDHGCTYPGCDRPPGWCDAHHVIAWSEGGSTSLHNTALLCRRHHTIVHRDHLTASRTDDGHISWERAGQAYQPPAA